MAEDTLTAEAPVWCSTALPRPSRVTFADVEQAGLVTRGGDGTYAAVGALADLLDAFDRRVRAIAAPFGAVENRYPALIPTGVLRRAGYFDSFPQFLMTATRLDPETPEERADGVPTGHCLSPTVCYHTYHQLAGTTLPEEGAVLTACGKIFRYEGAAARTLERLWDFTMREVVFLGRRETVAAVRQDLLTAVCAWIDDLRLAGHVEVANDPFFGVGSAGPAALQRALKLKYELHLPVVEDRTVAVGSFNLHGAKFGEAFGITTADGAPAHSGCIGIGLERIAYAFLCRHGADPAAWPAV